MGDQIDSKKYSRVSPVTLETYRNVTLFSNRRYFGITTDLFMMLTIGRLWLEYKTEILDQIVPDNIDAAEDSVNLFEQDSTMQNTSSLGIPEDCSLNCVISSWEQII
jgi:hypothetical protein